jgi:hypothetical protein
VEASSLCAIVSTSQPCGTCISRHPRGGLGAFRNFSYLYLDKTHPLLRSLSVHDALFSRLTFIHLISFRLVRFVERLCPVARLSAHFLFLLISKSSEPGWNDEIHTSLLCSCASDVLYGNRLTESFRSCYCMFIFLFKVEVAALIILLGRSMASIYPGLVEIAYPNRSKRRH